mmetsp:Transcript_4216/g.11199  ORF Transcript_4216/g.11199 Transcript_4216/m.11199 type:complete len:254 (-) Transcript_4216:97-858(-)
MDVAGRLLVPGRADPSSQRQMAEAAVMGGDGSSNYSSLTVEDDILDALLVWRCRWLGRILAWRWPCGTIYIGPHWYFSLVMLGFILGVGAFHCSSVQSGRWQLLGGVFVTAMSTMTFLRCALANPGVLLPTKSGRPAAVEEGSLALRPPARRRISDGGGVCHQCNLMQPKGCWHCEFCQVCVEGFDHHCPWMGKCIGKENLCAFYTFITVAFTSMAYIFILALLGPTTPTPAAKAAHLPFRPAASASEVVTMQ